MPNSSSIQTGNIPLNNFPLNDKGDNQSLKLTKLTIDEINDLRNPPDKSFSIKDGVLDISHIFDTDPNTNAISFTRPGPVVKKSYDIMEHNGKLEFIPCYTILRDKNHDTLTYAIHDTPFPEDKHGKPLFNPEIKNSENIRNQGRGHYYAAFNRPIEENKGIKDFLINSAKMPQEFMPDMPDTYHATNKPTTSNINNDIKSSYDNDKVKTPSFFSKMFNSKVFNSKNAIYFASGLSSLALIEMVRNLIELFSVKNNDDEFFDKIGDEAAQNAIENKIQEDFSKYRDIINNPESTDQDIADIKDEMSDKYIMSAVGDNIFSQAYVTEQYKNGELASIAQDAKEQATSSAKDFVKDIKIKDVAFNAGEAGIGLLLIATALKCQSNKKKVENKQKEEINPSTIDDKSKNNTLIFPDINLSSSKNNDREQFINSSSVSWK